MSGIEPSLRRIAAGPVTRGSAGRRAGRPQGVAVG